MKVTVTVRYSEDYLPTPRCLKFRQREAKKDTRITIRETTTEEASVAFVVHEYNGDFEYRYYEKKCWIRANWQDFVCGKTGLMPPEEIGNYIRGRYDYWNCDYKEARKAFSDNAKGFLIVDGILYREIGEPRYCVMTFGLGHNHGGTALMVSNHYNPNIGKSRYYSALDGDKAVAAANKIAARRGDTNDIGKFEKRIEVLLPEAVKVKPEKQHGGGDLFINSLEDMIEKTDSSFEAGILAIMMATSE